LKANTDVSLSARVTIIGSVAPGRGAFVQHRPRRPPNTRTGTQRGRGRVPRLPAASPGATETRQTGRPSP